MSNPSVFIGSSKEGLEFSRAVRDLLSDDCEITMWNEGFFASGSTFIETLTTKVPRFDFGVFIFYADDTSVSRGHEMISPRDNVIFELGLFMGHLGRERTFVVHQINNNIKIPSDLAGSTTLSYIWPRSDGNHRSAVGKACDEIRMAIEQLGISPNKAGNEISHIKSRQDIIENSVKTLQLVTKGLVTKFEYILLRNLAKDGPFSVVYHINMYDELKRLDAINYIQPRRGLNEIKARDHLGDEFDLKHYVFITEEGLEYLKLRDELLREPV